MMVLMESSRLIFQRLCIDDLEFMLHLTGDADVVRYLPGMITDREMMLGWFKSLGEKDNEIIVFLKETGEPIGECSMAPQIDGNGWEIGYMLLPEYWKQGYGTEIVQWIIRVARGVGVRRITAMTHQRNEASVRLLQKTGFKPYTVGWMLVDTGDELNDNQMEAYALDLKGE